MNEFLGAIKQEIKKASFRESFSAYDILWFVLAAFTAFRLGSGLTSDE